MHSGARTPEEIETLFEDAIVVGDRSALAELFEEGAILVVDDERPVRGGDASARLVLATWTGERIYVANPRQVVQARDVALVVGEYGITVVRRHPDGSWRYAIALLSVND